MAVVVVVAEQRVRIASSPSHRFTDSGARFAPRDSFASAPGEARKRPRAEACSRIRGIFLTALKLCGESRFYVRSLIFGKPRLSGERDFQGIPPSGISRPLLALGVKIIWPQQFG